MFHRMGRLQLGREERLLQASRDGDLHLVRELLAAGVDLDAVDWEERLTALMMAVVEEHYEIANALIAAGADVNKIVVPEPHALESKTPYGRGIESALDFALMRGPRLTTLLLEAGARLHSDSLALAMSSGDPAMVSVVRQFSKESPETPTELQSPQPIA